jgi:hypothetical protein
MGSVNYDITAQQHSTFDFHVEYLGTTGAGVDLAGYTSRFHVRPNVDHTFKYLDVTTAGVTTGGATGEYLAGITLKAGTSGSGGIYLNKGATGAGQTGGIRINVDATSMGYVRDGIWQYSLDITKGVTTDELLTGRFIVLPKVTR